MSYSQIDLAYKYARAFLNVYGKGLAVTDAQQLAEISHQLGNIKKFLVFADLTHLAHDAHDTIMHFLAPFGVHLKLSQLVMLLAQESRLALLANVLDALVDLFQQERGIVPCAVTSAYPLTQEQKGQVEQAISGWLAPRVSEMVYKLDKNLIAGIRIQLGLTIAECSIAQEVQKMRNNALVG